MLKIFSVKNVRVQKKYRRVSGLNIFLLDRGIAPHLYEYFFENPTTLQTAGKYDHLITGKVNIGFGKRMSDPIVYRSWAKELAKIHLTPESELKLEL